MAWIGSKGTTRRLMLAVLGLAVALGLYLPAVAIRRTPEPHVHVWVNDNYNRFTYPLFGSIDKNRTPVATTENALTPFWPRYRRYLLGRPWRKQAVCETERLLEVCEFARPDLVRRREDGKLSEIKIPGPISDEAELRYPGWFRKYVLRQAPYP